MVMAMEQRWSQGVWSALVLLGDRLAAVLPAILIALTLLALGLVFAWIARSVVARTARALGLDRGTERWGLAASMRRSGLLRPASEVVGLVCFWAIFILFATMAIDALGVPGAGSATAFVLAFLPPMFAAVLILVVGWLVANFLSQSILIAAVNAGRPEARLLARAVRYGVLLFAVATALTHLGIGKEMVLVAFGISFGGLVFALALAFGIGGRTLARELLERRLRRDTSPDHERLTHL
jgi:hypothetical protein